MLNQDILHYYPLIYKRDDQENQYWDGNKDLIDCLFINYKVKKSYEKQNSYPSVHASSATIDMASL